MRPLGRETNPGIRCRACSVNRELRRRGGLPDRRGPRVSRGQRSGLRVARARAPAARRGPCRHAARSAPREPTRRPALEHILADDGAGRRPIEMSERNFFAELKRRNVYKVAAAYAIVGWLVVQVATQVFPFFEIPSWVVRLVIVLV